MEVIKVLPEHETQGEYVLINERDFDNLKHKLYVEEEPSDRKHKLDKK